MRIAIVAATVFTCLGSVSLAHAQVSSTWTLASDYDFRGITQTAQDPAIQASLDYAHPSGWYVGGWASNLDYCPSNATSCLDADYELDLYTGFTGTIGDKGTGWDAGFIYYTYEEPDYNYREIYGALSKGPFKLKVSYSDDFGGDTTPGATPAFYADGYRYDPAPIRPLGAGACRLQFRGLLGRARRCGRRVRIPRLFGGRRLCDPWIPFGSQVD